MSYDISEEEILNYIKENERNDNLLFTSIPDTTMKNVISLAKSPSSMDNGFVLVDIKKEEIDHIDSMISKTKESLVQTPSNEFREKNKEILRSLYAVRELYKEDSIDLKEKKELEELSKVANQNEKDEELRNFLILSAIAEEYVIGSIAKGIINNPKLKENLGNIFDDLDLKLEYYNTFFSKEKIVPEEYLEFNDNSFSLIFDGYNLINQKKQPITCCITNFQNVSNTLVNRVFNTFTEANVSALRTMVFTADSSLPTIKCRDKGFIKEPYEYREYTLAKRK